MVMYFVSYILLLQVMLQNVVVAVLIENFAEGHTSEEEMELTQDLELLFAMALGETPEELQERERQHEQQLMDRKVDKGIQEVLQSFSDAQTATLLDPRRSADASCPEKPPPSTGAAPAEAPGAQRRTLTGSGRTDRQHASLQHVITHGTKQKNKQERKIALIMEAQEDMREAQEAMRAQQDELSRQMAQLIRMMQGLQNSSSSSLSA